MKSVATLGNDYTIIRKLGSGGSCVCTLAQKNDTKEMVAIKIFNNDFEEEMLLNEIQVMFTFDHVNVIKMIDHGLETLTIKNGRSYEVHYMVLEFAAKGDLFDIVQSNGYLSENMARHYFKGILEALDHINESGKCHRDLKLENVLIDKDNKPKLADFGFCTNLGGSDFTEWLGTREYMAPEIHARKPYNGKSVDIFALGIVLFIMVTGHPPFKAAKKDDKHYMPITLNDSKLFWKRHCANKAGGDKFLSTDLKDLVTAMLQYDPASRPSLMEIFGHPWMAQDPQ